MLWRDKRAKLVVSLAMLAVKARYDFGENRVATVALLTITTLPGTRSRGTVTAKFSGHSFTFRSWPTVLAKTRVSGSACTRILSGKPTESYVEGGNAFGLVFHLGFLTRRSDCRPSRDICIGVLLPEVMVVAGAAVAVVVAAVAVWAWGAAPPQILICA
jgi:hypothetical protein